MGVTLNSVCLLTWAGKDEALIYFVLNQTAHTWAIHRQGQQKEEKRAGLLYGRQLYSHRHYPCKCLLDLHLWCSDKM